MTQDEQVKLALEHARSMFTYHAGQRMSSLNFYLVAIAAFLMLYLHGRKRYDGQVFVFFVGLYAALRFVLEIFRSDDRGGLLGLSTSQLIGLVLLGGAVYAHQRLKQRAETLSAQPLKAVAA